MAKKKNAQLSSRFWLHNPGYAQVCMTFQLHPGSTIRYPPLGVEVIWEFQEFQEFQMLIGRKTRPQKHLHF